MKLDGTAPYDYARALRGAADSTVCSPLWDWDPDVRPLVLAERRRRGLIHDDEPIGDAEYS